MSASAVQSSGFKVQGSIVPLFRFSPGVRVGSVDGFVRQVPGDQVSCRTLLSLARGRVNVHPAHYFTGNIQTAADGCGLQLPVARYSVAAPFLTRARRGHSHRAFFCTPRTESPRPLADRELSAPPFVRCSEFDVRCSMFPLLMLSARGATASTSRRPPPALRVGNLVHDKRPSARRHHAARFFSRTVDRGFLPGGSSPEGLWTEDSGLI